MKKETVVHFVDVLNGPDNSHDYAFFGSLFDNAKAFKHSAKAKVGKAAPSVAVFEQVFKALKAGIKPKSVMITNAGRCANCGRKLTDTKSIIAGFGPECRENCGIPEPEITDEAAVAMTDAKTILSYMSGTHTSIMTFTNIASGNHFTYRFRPAKPREESNAPVSLPLDNAKFERMKQFRDRNDHVGDAKFLALSAEAGISIDDWRQFSEREKADSFKSNLSKATKPKAAYNGAALREAAEQRIRPVSDAEIEAAIAEYKANSPELYWQDGLLQEDKHAHAVAYNKFKHELERK